MAGRPSLGILRDIQTLFDAGTAGGLSDRQLLERFSSRRDASSDAAFEVLVLRHGPMVLRVCRNMLRNEADAADAFQATFLVLVRKRGSIRNLESVGGWLYGVACRVAARARVDANRRRRVEARASLRVVEAVDSEDERRMSGDFGSVVQEEVQRLPEKYRSVVVLCYWNSLTQEQAAAQLGCPLGTVRSRLARARELLHRRLTRRGLAPLAGIVAIGLDGSQASARALPAVPAALVHGTVRAAAQVASGQAMSYVLSATTASLVQRTLWSMAMIKIKTAAVGLALVGLLGVGATLGTLSMRASRAQAQTNAGASLPPQPADPPGTALVRLESKDHKSISTIVPNGSIVKKGDIICVLDSLILKDELVNQKVTTYNTKRTHRIAQVAREIAELSLVEFEEGGFRIQLAEAESALVKAEADLALAEAAAAKSTSDNEKKRSELLRPARVALDLAQTRKLVLRDFTKVRRIKELQLAVDNARLDELAAMATFELEAEKEKQLEREIQPFAIIAPRDGKLAYFYGPEGTQPRLGQRGDGTAAPWPFIEVGATVAPRQVLFRILPLAEPVPVPK